MLESLHLTAASEDDNQRLGYVFSIRDLYYKYLWKSRIRANVGNSAGKPSHINNPILNRKERVCVIIT